MKNESGKSTIILIILTVLIIIGVMVAINYTEDEIEKNKIKDLKTNMLLMQAKTKKGFEEVCFQTVNMDKTKEEDIVKINEIKKENLKGIILYDAPEEVQEAIKNVKDVTFDENCYYLDEKTLKDIGINNVNKDDMGYFIVKYNFETTSIEIISTKGYNDKYTLTQMIDTEEGEELK